MDAPKFEFDHLENFPPDILAYLVSYLPGEQLGRLKLTGARSLWYKLVIPKVVTSVSLGTDFLQFKGWPAYLHEFPSIEELVISNPNSDWWSKLRFNLSHIPPTVRKLAIIGKPSKVFLDKAGKQLNIDEQLPKLEELDYQGPRTKGEWMARLPSTLTKLTTLEWDAALDFPPSLIHLKLCVKSAESTLKLPVGLETYETATRTGLAAFPPSLRTFIATHYSRFSTSTHFPLPTTLTELEMPHQNFPSSLWSSLPSTLKKLVIKVNESDLVSMTIMNPLTRETHTVHSLPMEFLPNSISSLALRGSLVNTITPSEAILSSSSAFFPTSLTILSAADISITPTAAKLLPSSLTSLSIKNLCERICEHLPKGLTLLSAQPILTPNLIKLLPKSLHSLYLSCPSDYTTWFDYNTCSKLNSITNLEEYAIHKEYSKLHWQDEQSLPPNLTSLSFHGFNDLGDAFAQQKLPNLLSLGLSESFRFTDHCIPLLNRHLTSLGLGDSSKITGKCFPHLPRSLTFLDLRHASSIFDDDIQHLPQCLETANLAFATHLTDESIPKFPRTLKRLDLQNNEIISKACAPHLPYALKSSSGTFWLARMSNATGTLK